MTKKAYIGVAETGYLDSIGNVAVGDTVKINESGKPVDYLVVHKGNPDSSMYDASCDGVWVMRKDCRPARQWHTSGVNKYSTSNIHKYLNGSFLGILDADLQSAIKTVKIPHGGRSNTAVSSGANGLPTQVFLLGGREVGFDSTTSAYLPNDGACLDYYKNATNADRIAYRSGSATKWWLRSEVKDNEMYVWLVSLNGSATYYSPHNEDADNGYRPAMILPPTLSLVDGVVTGAQAELVTRGVARKIKKGYVGIGGVARKIQKAYIGIGGVARPCWSGGELAYYGAITPLSQGRYAGDCATVGNYALFGGGVIEFSYHWSDAMDAYDTSLVRSLPVAHEHREYYSAASVGDYAVFAGGKQSTTYFNAVCAYNKSLTRSTATTLSSARYNMGSTSFDKYALFAGGQAKSSQRYATIDAYSASLTRTSPTTLSGTRVKVTAVTVGGYVIFAGGGTSTTISGFVDTVDVFDASFTRTNVVALSERKTEAGATSVGEYAIIGGGYAYNASKGGYYTSTVDVYDSSLTKSTASNLSSNAGYVGATSVGGYALFAGGFLYDDYDYFDGLFYDAVDAYDVSLTKTVQNKLSVPRGEIMAVTIGDFAIFAGGRILPTSGTSASTDAVDVFTVA